jgi:ParB family chromosome partitioning protein
VGYFDHVSETKALEGVDTFAPGEVNRLGKLEKAQIASEAERLAAGTGWLPAMFRAREAAAIEVIKPHAEAQADAEAQEGTHAMA